MITVGSKSRWWVHCRWLNALGRGALLWTTLLWATNGWAELNVTVRGVSDEVADNIMLHLSQWQSLPSDNVRVVEEEFSPAVQRALRALGYYEATQTYSLEDDNLTLAIEPGSPVVWGASDIRLLSERDSVNGELAELVANPPFPEGQRINHQTYENYKRRLLSQAAELGYLDARLRQSRLAVDVEAGEARASLHLATGARYRIDSVSYDDTILNQSLLDEVAQVPVGDWYSPNRVGEIYNRLLNTGYFAHVAVVTDKRPPEAVNLHIELTDQPAHQVSTGVGFGTDDYGPRFRLRWTQPLINPAGHSMHNQLKVSRVEQDLESQYRIPWDHPQNAYVALNAGWQRKDTEELVTSRAKSGVAYHRVLPGGWQYSLKVNLENENTRLGDQPEESFTYVIPSVSLVRRRFHGDPVNPRRGYKAWIDFATSREEIGSDTDFRRLDLGVNTVYTLFERHSVLTRWHWGGIETNNIGLVPPSQRFFTGGDQTVRGYKFESIAPEDLEGNILGGQYMTVGSLEYRYRWAKNWQSALFVDSGRVFSEDTTELPADPDEAARLQASRAEDRKYKTSVGVGVRWQTPIGAIALDVASPLDEEDSRFRLHLYLGTSL